MKGGGVCVWVVDSWISEGGRRKRRSDLWGMSGLQVPLATSCTALTAIQDKQGPCATRDACPGGEA